MRHLLLLVGVAFALPLFVSCERVNLDEVSPAEQSQKIIPIGHGRGTQEFPLTAQELQQGVVPQSVSECWVIGYVVGSTYKTMNNASFQAVTTYETNILLSNDSLCESSDDCIAIELSSASSKKSFSLSRHPEGWRQPIVVCGTWGRYFGRNGLRSVSRGYYLPGFDMGTILPSPSSWDVENREY